MYKTNFKYEIETITDKFNGGTDIDAMTTIINRRAANGWRLSNVFTNELGKNALAVGGLGVNSTVDQTVLIFEKQVDIPHLLPIKHVVPVSKCNIFSPLVPRTLTVHINGDESLIQLSLAAFNQDELQGIATDISISNILGDVVVLKNICFFSFVQDRNSLLTTETLPIELPEHIKRSVSEVTIHVIKYTLNGIIYTPDQTEVSSLLEVIKTTSNRASFDFDKETFFAQISAMQNAREIKAFFDKNALELTEIFSADIIEQLNRIANMEKMYGNSKRNAIHTLETYLEQIE